MLKYGVLVISHGSRNEKWVHLVDEAVNAMQIPDGIPVYASFLEIVEGRLIQDGITHLESLGVTDIIAVPLFISSGSTHIDEISYALGVKPEPVLPTDMTPFAIQAKLHFTNPIDDDPIIAQILYEKMKPLSLKPAEEIVLLVGHGSVERNFHILWRRGLERLASRLKEYGDFDEVDVAMLLPDQIDRKMNHWLKLKPNHMVLVVPVFLSEGYFTNEVIPERLQGYTYKYNGSSLLPHPLVARWLERQTAIFWERV
ncbi:sirohydrochlorin chelatase [Paenibacillus agricola]|uniref:Cobalamin biosynthesis protein CbiX n=1 Tax=Paenibacillus agricola TaxID=2716264 RepID=A0ABX0J3G0_9BACL|nr:CbiX/SirB N-terminal domain-containing protein [Paenibacillus agricola]NHN29659.1 cobalamin biosynthesis protein CbiX [Paenibacillus agricola]